MPPDEPDHSNFSQSQATYMTSNKPHFGYRGGDSDTTPKYLASRGNNPHNPHKPLKPHDAMGSKQKTLQKSSNPYGVTTKHSANVYTSRQNHRSNLTGTSLGLVTEEKSKLKDYNSKM